MTFWKRLSSRFLFLGKAMIPSPLLLTLLLLGIGITTLGAFWGWGWVCFSIYNGILFSLLIIDIYLVKQLPKLIATRQIDSLFEIAEDNTVRLIIRANAPLSTKMWVQDDYPHGFHTSERTFYQVWKNETSKVITYYVKPHRRGRHQFEKIHLRLQSQFRLLHIQQSFTQRMEVKVYPRLEAVRRVRKGFYRRQSLQDGRALYRSFGAGKEFSHIREYIPDDDPRQINWMATARRGKLVSNVYHPEAGQQVAILLDCGRLMGVHNEGRTQLDYALEAVLGYAAIALQRGEQVSFIAFSDQILRFVPLGKGIEHLNRIVEASFDLEPSYKETDYLQVWNLLQSMHRHRSLVTLFTDMGNITFAESLQNLMSYTKKKFAFLTVSMQNPRLIDQLKQPLVTEEDIYRKIAIEELQQERKRVLRYWSNQKVGTLDVMPDQLASAVIDTYLKIRSRVET
ncbi:DUF58 domain-containing protein [Thermoflavimicrobium daqui]|nr:DUF58 domain-containing protein [Thermoflavimicrobium daqui]